MGDASFARVLAIAAALLAAPAGAAAQASPLENWSRLMDQLKAAGAAADAQLPPGLTAQDQSEVAVLLADPLFATR